MWFIDYVSSNNTGHVQSHTHAFTYSRIHTLTHSHTHTFTYSRIHTLTHSHTHALTYSRIHTLTHSHILTHSRTHRFTHSHTHAFTRTNPHTCTSNTLTHMLQRTHAPTHTCPYAPGKTIQTDNQGKTQQRTDIKTRKILIN